MSTETARKPTERQLKAWLTVAYDKGVADGERKKCRHCTSKKLTLLTIANRNLWEILQELDRAEPINGVVLSIEMADNVVKALRRGKKNFRYANIIRRQIRECDRTFDILMRTLLDPEERPDSQG